MGLYNVFLRSLLEAADDEADDAAVPDPDEAAETIDDAGTDEPPPDDTTDGGDEDTGDDNAEENHDEEQTEEEGDQPPEGDDFNLDDDSDPDDMSNEPAPDGLPEADDDGSGDIDEEDPDAETNVQVNILELSKLDRVLAKQKCYRDFMDLRATVRAMLNIIDKNETVIDPDVRDDSIAKLNKLHYQIEEFVTYRFGIMNYEDALQHYFIFVKTTNNLINYIKEDGLKKKPK